MDASAATHKLVKVPTEALTMWDSTYDTSGRLIADRSEKDGGVEQLRV